MSEALDVGPNKIDINTADAAAISILPGINIVGAKKIVEYRDLNGLFKNVDDFIKVSGVKEHFIEKIKTMVFAGKPEVKQNNDEDYGRIVDF
ncbi:helix-hairpin-helix domain-containing protein [bacterium]|nr:helix-hairpin-helix domain-containing protein [bacterium]